MDEYDRRLLESHIEWLEGDHERCNPSLARILRGLLAGSPVDDPRCVKCGHPKSNHPFRHQFQGG